MKIKITISVFVLFCIVFMSCKKTEGPEGPQGPQGLPGSQHYVGEYFEGGLVYYVSKDASGTEHGLIVSLQDAGAGAWGLNNVNVTGAQSRWDGKTNTASMISAGGAATEAAGLCVNYRGGGKSDWFLPSVDQLNMLDNVAYTINQILESDGKAETEPLYFGDSGEYYWTSTQYDPEMACGFKYVAALASKSKVWKVRAVRAF